MDKKNMPSLHLVSGVRSRLSIDGDAMERTEVEDLHRRPMRHRRTRRSLSRDLAQEAGDAYRTI